MKNENEQVIESKIPYLSAAKMEKLMELVSERSLSSITPEYFKNYGFGQADAYLAINTLKFLGIVEDSGKSTEVLRKFQLRGDTRNTETQQILKVAYKKLFGVIGEPHKLSKDDLTNEFMHHYSLSRRVAVSAVPAFLKLCEFSGLLEQGSVLTRKRNTDQSDKIKKDRKVYTKTHSSNDSNLLAVIPIVDGKMELRIPHEVLTRVAFGGDIADDIKLLTKQLSDFAEKHCKNNLENNET